MITILGNPVAIVVVILGLRPVAARFSAERRAAVVKETSIFPIYVLVSRLKAARTLCR